MEDGALLDPADIKLEPADIKQEMDPDSTTGNSPKKKGRPKKMKQEKITDHVTVVKKERKKVDRFKGMPEEEVLKRLLPDHLAPNLDIVIVGINPGLYAAFVGHHYAGPGNHFWKCMYLSGLIPEPMNAMQDFKLLEYGIGFTNIVARTSRGSADLSRKEIKEGAQILTEKLVKYKPKIAVFNGKGIYEVFAGHKNFSFGKQPDLLPGTQTAVYVMPSSSARCSQLPRAVDKVPFYEALKKFRDHLNGKLPDLQESEITFPDVFLKTAVKKEPKEENSEQYPGEMSAEELSQFTEGSYQVIPHQPQTSTGQSLPPNNNNIPPQNGSQLPPGQVQVKQEPVDPDFPAQTSQSDTMALGQGQFEVYNHSGAVTQGDAHLNNFLNGLYGLVDQVADGNKSQSKYGIVNQAGISNTPLQFNDALRDIVKEGAEGEMDAGPSFTELTPAKIASPPSQPAGKGAKNTKSRKRKSTTNTDDQSNPSNTSSPMSSNQSPKHSSPLVPHMSPPSSSSQLSASSSPNMPGSAMPPYMNTMPQNAMPPSCLPGPFPPHTSNMPYSSMPPYTSPMGFPQPYPSHAYSNTYPGILSTIPNSYAPPYMGLPLPNNGGMPGYQVPPHGYPGMPGYQGQPGFDPSIQIKQEKPDI